MSMLKLTELNQPRIDIELYSTDSYIAPIDKVRVMDEDSFEQFTVEWLYGCKKSIYSSIQRIGGSGDKGRDIIAKYDDGSVDYYQCKHYNAALTPTDFYLELGKLCYYTYKKEIPIPRKYYIIASNDVGPSLQDLLDNTSKLRLKLLQYWDQYCRNKITKSTQVFLDAAFSEYINIFDFSIIETYPMAQVIDEYLGTIYGSIRFGGRKISLPTLLMPINTEEPEEMNYISALLEAYSDELGIPIDSTDSLKEHGSFFEHFNRQRKDYYSVETIRRFVRDTLTDSQQIDILKEEIYDGIIDTHERDYDSGYKRLVADLEQASVVNTSKCLLDSKLHIIGNNMRKGTCHMLVNDNRLRWVKSK